MELGEVDVEHIATIQFIDSESGDEAYAFVRATSDLVLIGLSLRSDGDIEVGMKLEDFERLMAALQVAATIVKSDDK